jgi:hypothetical protein
MQGSGLTILAGVPVGLVCSLIKHFLPARSKAFGEYDEKTSCKTLHISFNFTTFAFW